jgi:hypothetical protein
MTSAVEAQIQAVSLAAPSAQNFRLRLNQLGGTAGEFPLEAGVAA